MQNQNLLPQSNVFSELDLKVYVRIIWQWSWLIILCTVVAGAMAYVISSFSEPIYQSSSTILINQARNPTSSADYQDLMTSERMASTYAQLIKRDSLLVKVATQLGVDEAVFKQSVTGINVTAVRDTQLLKLDVEGTSPQLVAAVAYTLPLVFIDEIRAVQSERFSGAKNGLQSQLQDLNNQIEQTQVAIDKLSDSHTAEEGVELGRLRFQLSQYQTRYTSLLQSLGNLQITELQSTDTISVVEEPKVPTAPIRPRIFVNTLLAAVVGAMLALGLIFLIEYLDDRIKTPQDLASIVDAPLLGSIARMQGKSKKRKPVQDALGLGLEDSLITAVQPRHPITEAYRALRTNLQFSSVDQALTSLLVTSASPGEGKTTTAANLAIVMAQSGKSVLLIDADLRKPRQHQIFGLPQSPGLTDALINSDSLPLSYVRPTTVPNLNILTSGKTPPNPAELLGSQRMHQFIQQLHEQVDLIIFDVPPVLAVTDAQVLASQVNGVVLVIDSEQTERAKFARAVEALLHTNVRLLGTVLNRLTRSARGYYYYYNEYSAYYSDEPASNQTASKQTKNDQQTVSVKQRARNFMDEELSVKPAVNGVYQIQYERPGSDNHSK